MSQYREYERDGRFFLYKSSGGAFSRPWESDSLGGGRSESIGSFDTSMERELFKLLEAAREDVSRLTWELEGAKATLAKIAEKRAERKAQRLARLEKLENG